MRLCMLYWCRTSDDTVRLEFAPLSKAWDDAMVNSYTFTDYTFLMA